MRKVFLISVLLLCGCTKGPDRSIYPTPDITVDKYESREFRYVVDERTGVVYIVMYAGYKGGITVAYNADGTVMKREDLCRGCE